MSCRPWPAVLASYYLPVSAPRPDRGSKSHAQILMSGEFDPPRHACYRWTRAPTSTHASAWVHAGLKHGQKIAVGFWNHIQHLIGSGAVGS